LVKLYQMHKRSEVSLAGSETIIRKFCGWKGQKNK
jgi:hypothetical protein